MKLNKTHEWEYKVVTTDQLLKEPQGHDIAVSQEADNAIRDVSRNSIQNSLNTLGQEGWEFITVFGEFCIFKKSKNGF